MTVLKHSIKELLRKEKEGLMSGMFIMMMWLIEWCFHGFVSVICVLTHMSMSTVVNDLLNESVLKEDMRIIVAHKKKTILLGYSY